MSLSPDTLAALHALRWWRVCVRLRCERNTMAREHPLFVFKAMSLYACNLGGVPQLQEGLRIHPLDPLGHRVKLHKVYEVAFIFRTTDAAAVQAFCVGLSRHLSREWTNFSLKGPPFAQARCLADLEAETLPHIDLQAAELALDFLTPLSFARGADAASKAKAAQQALAPEAFLDLVVRRLREWLPGLTCPRASGLQSLSSFWSYKSFEHESKSGPAAQAGGKQHKEMICGMQGPWYLRGAWQPWLPLLLLGAELHPQQSLESRTQGHYQLSTGRARLDRTWLHLGFLREDFDRLLEQADGRDPFLHALGPVEERLQDLVSAVLDGTYAPTPAHQWPQPRSSGGVRWISTLAPCDLLLQRAAHRLLVGVVDSQLEDASHAYRPGRSTKTALAQIREAHARGYKYGFKADIEGFFDAIDWAQMEGLLEGLLPLSEVSLLRFLRQVIRHPVLAQGDGLSERTQGLLQGSPLSPLLSNLYLDRFDEEMAALGFPLVRYGDDFVLLARDPGELEEAEAAARRTLQRLGLQLKEPKIFRGQIDLSFEFLGRSLPLDPEDQESLAAAALRLPLFIQEPGVMAAIDGRALHLRRWGRLIDTVPLTRVSEIIFLGNQAVSTALLRHCLKERIPVTFCSALGNFAGSLHPDARSHFELATQQAARHAELGAAGRLHLGQAIIEAKVRHYLEWIESSASGPTVDTIKRALRKICEALHAAPSVESLRGYEGEAAALCHAWVQSGINQPEFLSQNRLPKEKADPWNCALDLAYWLLFTRLNSLLRGQGLNPYLGFVHSPKDHYESLVYDLVELFRCRVDRMLRRLINHKQLKAADFENPEPKKWRTTTQGLRTIIQGFEEMLDTPQSSHGGQTLRHLMVAQVTQVKLWAQTGQQPVLYRPPLRPTVPVGGGLHPDLERASDWLPTAPPAIPCH